MGVVYKAEDLKLKRCVALKFLPPHLMDLPELKERFLVEAQAAAVLSHSNICTIYEVGESEDRPYIVMEYVEGETLAPTSWSRRRAGPRSWTSIAGIYALAGEKDKAIEWLEKDFESRDPNMPNSGISSTIQSTTCPATR